MTDSTTNTLRATLLPCPFCGDDHARVEVALEGLQVSCNLRTGCGALTDYRDTDVEAIAAWNRRAALAANPATQGEPSGNSGALQYGSITERAEDGLKRGQWATPAQAQAVLADELTAICAAADSGAGGWVSTARIREALCAAAPPVAPAPAEPERNNPISALAIRALVAAGKVSQEDANAAFHAACYAMQEEAIRMGQAFPWVVAPIVAAAPAQPQPPVVSQPLTAAPVEPVATFTKVRSIIHDCPAIKLPQSFLLKLGNTAQIVVLKGADDALADILIARLNGVHA